MPFNPVFKLLLWFINAYWKLSASFVRLLVLRQLQLCGVGL